MNKKCSSGRRAFPPGQHGPNMTRRNKMSNYALQLREKQKAKAIYGVLERQFRLAFQYASRSKGVTGVKLLQLMERRLDNVVFRLGFATTRRQARQWVGHGHVKVDGKKVDIPSFRVRPDHAITLGGSETFVKELKEIIQLTEERAVPKWLQRKEEQFSGIVTALPEREDMPGSIQEQLIVELYSK